ncbi:MAG: lipase family protein [Cyanosarcina radialis HA8281-LM2]|jgi:hypothetical protein|nr:lipase family protein [Cyanosarcina radialis HA8281-LM2]
MKEIKISTDANEDKISQPEKPIQLEKYPEIDPEIAWELANLVRISYADHGCFNNWFETKKEPQEFTLEANRRLENIEFNNNWIYAKKEIESSPLTEYYLLNEEDLKNENIASKFPDSDYYKYKILKTYEYTSYYPINYFLNKKIVDIDRFGFIAERQERKDKFVFVIFRGTLEPAEWFSNAQFKQLNFLTRTVLELKKTENKETEDFGKISLGFNKMYTDFRPGIIIGDNYINKISIKIDSVIRQFLWKKSKFKLKNQSIYQAINDYVSNQNLDRANVYIAGHSLGGALATIAALDIARQLDIAGKNKLKSPIGLYTFASPRVGDNKFADKFNEFMSDGKIESFRFANSEDLVTKIPLPVWFKLGIDLDRRLILKRIRSLFNTLTRGVFETDYQHIGIPIYFTHQARRTKNGSELESTATVGDNHNMTRTYCGALEKNKRKERNKKHGE